MNFNVFKSSFFLCAFILFCSNCTNSPAINDKYDFNSVKSIRIDKISEGGIEICIEAAGTTNSIELGFSLINKTSGELFFASHPPTGEKICIDPHELISGKKIFGSWGGGTNPDKDFPKLFKALQNQEKKLNKLTENQYSLEDINLAIEHLEQKRVLRPIIKMTH